MKGEKLIMKNRDFEHANGLTSQIFLFIVHRTTTLIEKGDGDESLKHQEHTITF
jgi:hypothetical protein